MMRALVRLGLCLVLLGTIGACGRWRDHDDDVVVTQELATLQNGCVVRGTVRNDGDHTVRVFLSWRAFDRDDDFIGTAEAEVDDLPRDGTRSYESSRFREVFDRDLIRCDRIVRIRRSTTAVRD